MCTLMQLGITNPCLRKSAPLRPSGFGIIAASLKNVTDKRPGSMLTSDAPVADD